MEFFSILMWQLTTLPVPFPFSEKKTEWSSGRLSVLYRVSKNSQSMPRFKPQSSSLFFFLILWVMCAVIRLLDRCVCWMNEHMNRCRAPEGWGDGEQNLTVPVPLRWTDGQAQAVIRAIYRSKLQALPSQPSGSAESSLGHGIPPGWKEKGFSHYKDKMVIETVWAQMPLVHSDATTIVAKLRQGM